MSESRGNSRKDASTPVHTGHASLYDTSQFDLTGKVVVVTGGNRGIGLGYARGLARAGAKVAIWARSTAASAEAVEVLSQWSDSFAIACDVTDEASVDHALEETTQRLGPVDAGFANVGISSRRRFVEMDLSDWREILTVNLDGTFLALRAMASQAIDLERPASLVVTSSIGAHHGIPLAPHYSATKAGQIGLVKGLAVSLARYRIRVNAVLPGWVTTEMTTDEQEHDQFVEALKARVPMRRWGAPEDFEAIAVYLVSDGSSFMTGAEIVIDGGYSAY